MDNDVCYFQKKIKTKVNETNGLGIKLITNQQNIHVYIGGLNTIIKQVKLLVYKHYCVGLVNNEIHTAMIKRLAK